MTDAIAALANLVNLDNTLRDNALADFYKKWHQDPLVLDIMVYPTGHLKARKHIG